MMHLKEIHLLEIEVRLSVLFMKKRNEREFSEDGGILVGILCYGRRKGLDGLVLANTAPWFKFFQLRNIQLPKYRLIDSPAFF